MNTQEQFLLRQLAAVEADLDRFNRMLDGLRRLTMNQHACSDIEAELHLQDDRTWNKLRRQQAAARRSWLSFNRALEKHRKAHPAPESGEVASPGDMIEDPPCPEEFSTLSSPPPASMQAPRPQPNPTL